MNLSLQIMEKYLQRTMEEFDSNPLAGRLMRRLASELPDVFFSVAINHLNSDGESNAHRLLAILLLRQETLLERLASPAYNTRENAVRLFRRFLEVDSAFDVKMARKLPGRNQATHKNSFDGMHSTRALDILDETSTGRRLLPILGHLPDSQDSRISAKATLFVGRRVQNPAWIRKQLSRGDQRVRANAVEALWGVQTPPAVRLLEECATDQNHRVAGNSLVGLHFSGIDSARAEAIAMSRRGKAETRSAAAWVMGKIGMPEFAPRLTELIRDEQPQVRSAALRAMMDLRRQEATGLVAMAVKTVRPSEEAAVVETAPPEEVNLVPIYNGNYIVRR